MKSNKIMFCVAFIKESGLKLIEHELIEAVNNGTKILILTSSYMHVTEPNSLYFLKSKLGNQVEIKLYDLDKHYNSFHPKSYIFDFGNGEGEVLIGSSNVTKTALTSGIEWNYRVDKINNLVDYNQFVAEFCELYTENSFYLTNEWLREYAKNYKNSQIDKSFNHPITKTKTTYKENQHNMASGKVADSDCNDYIIQDINSVEPIKCQIQALYELSLTREEGYHKAMVILATGLGKTYLSAFDSLTFKKVLFIAHRQEILNQAASAYKRVRPDKTVGFFNSKEKNSSCDLLFASVQTLGKSMYLNESYFFSDAFDYIVIDEFHHACAKSYKRIVDYFKPKFMLGLTATPDRLDNKDVYGLCDGNIAFECNFVTAINNGWLVPFDYYGIYDDVDYTTIPWRSGKYDLQELENRLIVKRRLENIYKKYKNYAGSRSIGFCCSIKHCDEMTRYFKAKGIIAEAIHSGIAENRQNIIDRFVAGKIKILFVVDIFNEGVDIPSIDTVIFLRPTESYAVFMQQLGRGLRTYSGKDMLRVLDFIGNYKNSHLKAGYLMGKTPRELSSGTIPHLIGKDYQLPEGCKVNFDMTLIDYFTHEINKRVPQKQKLINEYLQLAEMLGKTPSMMDVLEAGNYPVNLYLKTFGSWLCFLEEAERLSVIQESFLGTIVEEFLLIIEKTVLTKLFKIPTLLAFVSETGMTSKVSIDEIIDKFIAFYQDEINAKEMNNQSNRDYKTWNRERYRKYIVNRPIYYLVKSSDGMFRYDKEAGVLNVKEELEPYINKYPEEIGREVKDRLVYRWKDRVKRCFND